MVERKHTFLSVVRQCRLLDISRSSVYYRSSEAIQEDLEYMRLMDRQYLATPFYGSRRFSVWLRKQGYCVNRKRVRRLMRIMGLRAIYRRPRTSKPGLGHRIYPYLLGGMEITRPNQVWAADITYIPMARGFLYLVTIMDWYSRYVISWRLSNTLEPTSASKLWRKRSGEADRTSSTRTRGASLPAKPSPSSSSNMESESAWTGRGGIGTTSSLRGCGAQ